MFIEVAERSVDGSAWLTKCERCGTSLDWVSSLDITMMSVRGLRNLCFGCDPGADVVPVVFRVDGGVADYVMVRHGRGLVAIDTRAGEHFAVVGYDKGAGLGLVDLPIACPVVHISAKPAASGFAEIAGRGAEND